MRPLFILFLAIGLCTLAAYGEDQEEDAAPEVYRLGAKVADFSGPGLGGGTVKLSDLTVTREKAEAAVLDVATAFANGKEIGVETPIDTLAGILDEDGDVDDYEKADLIGKAGRHFGLVATAERADEMATLADVAAWITSAKDAPIAVVLWSSGCDTCVHFYNEKTNEMMAEENARMLVVASHPYDSTKLIRERLDGFPFYWKVVLDQDQPIKDLFVSGGTRTPHVFLLDKDHVLGYRGSVDSDARLPNGDEDLEEYLRDAVRALKEEREVKKKETEPKGCPLKLAKR